MDELAGFCHWPAAPAPEQQNSLTRDEDWPQLANQLAQLLNGPADWPSSLVDPLVAKVTSARGAPTDVGDLLQADGNPRITSGFTYLLQLLVHDLVNTQTPFWAVDPQLGTRNLQPQPLQLAALYGGGPSLCPLAYEPAGDEPHDRFKLRMQPFDPSPIVGASVFRDLMRVQIPYGPGRNTVEPLVADPRNADNLMVAQITTLFALLHNIVADQITGNPAFQAGMPASVRGQAIFSHARVAVTRIFRRIVLGQLMDKILHPDIRDAYREAPQLLGTGTGMPLELSHGVLRFGHAMVRDSYVPNTTGGSLNLASLLQLASQAQFGLTTLAVRWQLSWSRFFQMDEKVVPNFSRRIGPGMSYVLFKPDSFEPIDPSAQGGLPYRDLKSAMLAGLWSVDALIDEIRRLNPKLLPVGWCFGKAAARTSAIAGWLAAAGSRKKLPVVALDLDRMAADPPLPLFVLLEAALDPDIEGRHLGVLGSIILADVVFGIAHQTPASAYDAIAVALSVDQAERLDAIDTIEACIRYVENYTAPAPVAVA